MLKNIAAHRATATNRRGMRLLTIHIT